MLAMKTIQITVNESLLKHVDRAVAHLKTSRSAFIRDSLKTALTKLETRALETKHRRGYQRHPAAEDELTLWENEQAWGDE